MQAFSRGCRCQPNASQEQLYTSRLRVLPEKPIGTNLKMRRDLHTKLLLVHAMAVGVPLDDGTGETAVLTPNEILRRAIGATWAGSTD